MSLSGSRRLSVTSLAGVERQGHRSMSGGGAEVGLSCSLPVSTSAVCGTHPFSVLQPQFHQGPSHGEGSSVFGAERSCRARSFTFSGLLQPTFCGDESLRVVETGYRFVNPQSESLQDSLQDGDPSVSAERKLDGIHTLKDAYLQIPIHPDSRKYLRFVALNQVFHSRLFVSASPRLCRFSHGSWLRYRLFSIV